MRQIHCVMKNADDLDDPVAGAIEDEVTAPPPGASDVEGPDAIADFLTHPAPKRLRPVFERLDRQKQRLAIDARLARPEPLARPGDDIDEVTFGDGAKSNTPGQLGQA
jgi:hypothetical protein